jgi:hypothetical protein
LLLRIAAPNEQASVDWVLKNATSLQLVGDFIPNSPWTEPQQYPVPEGKFANHQREYAIYKTHREIVKEVLDLDQCRIANAIFTYIVWFRRIKRPDGGHALQQVYPIRRALIALGNDKLLPSVDNLDANFSWIASVAQALADIEVKDQQFAGKYEKIADDYKCFKKFLVGRPLFGWRQKDKIQKSSSKSSKDRITEVIWEGRSGNKWNFSTAPFEGQSFDPASWSQPSVTKNLADDDGGETDAFEFKNSKRSGRDGAYKARWLANTVLLGGITGYDHKETDTPVVAGYLLSQLTPRSPEALLAVISIVLGRQRKSLKLLTANDGQLALDSVQNPSLPVSLSTPTSLDILSVVSSLDPAHKAFKRSLKASGKSLGSRVSIDALARFGVMRFHGRLGVVQSEQLQGKLVAGRVTAIYVSLSNSDFQDAFNVALMEFCEWILTEAPYVDADWRSWVGEISSASDNLPPVVYSFGSKQGWTLDGPAKKQIHRRLRDSYSVFGQALTINECRDGALGYLKTSALALNMAAMAITGMRPLTEATKLAVGDGHLCIADKRCYGELETRMLSVPNELIRGLRIHLGNVDFVSSALNLNLNRSIAESRHPFIFIGLDKASNAELVHLSQADALAWLRDIADDDELKANSPRHGKATELAHASYADGVTAQQLGHDRVAVSGSSHYISSPALCDYQCEFDGVPVINELRW